MLDAIPSMHHSCFKEKEKKRKRNLYLVKILRLITGNTRVEKHVSIHGDTIDKAQIVGKSTD